MIVEDSKINETMIMKVLSYGYDKALNGIPTMDTCYKIADDYLKKDGNLIDKANNLVKWQIAKCGTCGFVTNLGGWAALPVSIPANVSSVIYLQLRMIAALAIMGGHDPKDDQVQSLAYVCLCGSSAVDVLKNIGIQIGSKLTKQMIQNISRATIVKINRAVGFRLVTKFGTQGVINLGKAIPIVGGFTGGSVDAFSTRKIGKIATKVFIPQDH